jgi:peptidoglycan/LPS O-acetylase OafA/YrhL
VLPDAYLPRLLVVLGPVLLVAAASWYLVERPLIAWAGRSRPGRDGDRDASRAAARGRSRVQPQASRAAPRGGSRAQPQLEAQAAP